ncbi:MAG: EamA family transporter [Candidatus Heimdallarchaeota archaeon]|nr:EamA family transporter [Candidatus Heimdallarchaeota archaeon]
MGSTFTNHNNDIPFTSILQALLVTVLWSSSWIIIKFGLKNLTPVMFAGMRYSAASIVLLIILFRDRESITILHQMPRLWWLNLAFYGLIFISITQAMQFVGLALLPAITVTFMLNFTAIFVLILAIFLIDEIPNFRQAAFVVLGFAGVLVYFYPFDFGDISIWGLIAVSIGVIANALSSILGRKYNRDREYSPLIITTISMTIGSLVLLIFGLLIEGVPQLGFLNIIYILWLAIVNTAFAFVLWNKAMQELSAIQITLINGTMLPQITILSIIFLGERPANLEWLGIFCILVSAIAIQLVSGNNNNNRSKQIEGSSLL